ncbi:hypothetical protein ACNPM4_00425 [Microbacterium sp. AGC62]
MLDPETSELVHLLSLVFHDAEVPGCEEVCDFPPGIIEPPCTEVSEKRLIDSTCWRPDDDDGRQLSATRQLFLDDAVYKSHSRELVEEVLSADSAEFKSVDERLRSVGELERDLVGDQRRSCQEEDITIRVEWREVVIQDPIKCFQPREPLDHLAAMSPHHTPRVQDLGALRLVVGRPGHEVSEVGPDQKVAGGRGGIDGRRMERLPLWIQRSCGGVL